MPGSVTRGPTFTAYEPSIRELRPAPPAAENASLARRFRSAALPKTKLLSGGLPALVGLLPSEHRALEPIMQSA